MLAEERQSRILACVRERGYVSVSELVDQHQVSEATIRRDLDALAKGGRLRRLRGGASDVKATVRPEQDVRTFAEVASDESFSAKRAIAELAAQQISDGEFVALDSGTTVAAMCSYLFDRSITVATASLPVIAALEKSASVDLIVIGGVLRPSYRSLVGQLALSTIAQLRFDVCFLGTSGVMDDGTVLDTSPSEVPMKQALLASSRRAFLLADVGKFPGTGLQRVCGVDDLDGLITDQPPVHLQLSTDADTEVLVV